MQNLLMYTMLQSFANQFILIYINVNKLYACIMHNLSTVARVCNLNKKSYFKYSDIKLVYFFRFKQGFHLYLINFSWFFLFIEGKIKDTKRTELKFIRSENSTKKKTNREIGILYRIQYGEFCIFLFTV